MMQGESTQEPVPTFGVFGGTFDPVHLGHLGAAEDALAAAGLDRILWVPNRRSPLKPDHEMASDAHRLAMVELAVAEQPAFEVSRAEIDGPAVSYSIDTLDALAAEHPRSRIRFLIGEDSLAELHAWKDPERLVRTYRPLVVGRPGSDHAAAACRLPADLVDQLHADTVRLTLRDISATDIRARVAAGKPINTLVPATVADYIARHHLYR